MKKNLAVLTAVLLLAISVFALAGCSGANSIIKAFNENGYTVSTKEVENIQKINAQLKENNFKIKITLLKKDLSMVAIMEFKSSKELEKSIDENALLKTAILTFEKADIINKNCLLLILSPVDMKKCLEIFKNA